jgi:UDP-N-acetylglucosamine--N-acetylmuramyl-(pentapeptide) pyrophosphoryl-undecaprenol N-acetylglucosamine transferase
MAERTVFLSAGGTGGHLFPAEALAHELKARGWLVHLLTDIRAKKFTKRFPAENIHIIRSATFASKNPIAILRTLRELLKGYGQSRRLTTQFDPQVIVGFGGYPTLPPLFAARRAGVPIILQEQNAILGRANRALASTAKAIAVGFPQVGAGSELANKTVVTGNPLRPPVKAAASHPYSRPKINDDFNLLIFGGSQGAHFFSIVLPAALALMPKEMRQRLKIVQQARPEDEQILTKAYGQIDIKAEVSPFFDSMPMRIANSHLVICRAGASSVAELTAIGRPSILVPLPHSLDGDQAANAADLAGKGGAWIVPQAELSANKLSALICDAMNDADALVQMAATAKLAAKPNAAERLAELVEHVARGGTTEEFKETLI